ncbi:unnamed protein product [Debaryomyces tyrocola]|nr:unnamed protein product [Debaryomyces tyrocola]
MAETKRESSRPSHTRVST